MRCNIALLVIVLLVCLACFVECKKNKPKKPKRPRRLKCSKNDVKEGVIEGKKNLKRFESRGYKFQCLEGGIMAKIDFVGENGSCRGLPPNLYVDVLKCHWQQSCTVRYKRQGVMINKLFGPSVSSCILAVPERYTVRVECLSPSAKIFDVSGHGNEVEVGDMSGILRSHEYHPWLYKHDDKQSKVTLVRPEGKKNLAYTIRSLNIWDGDELGVRWTSDTGDGMAKHKHSTDNVTIHDASTTHLEDVKDVTFTLETKRSTLGGDGFTVCFKWLADGEKADSACHNLLYEGNLCKPKKNKKKKGNRRKRNKNKN